MKMLCSLYYLAIELVYSFETHKVLEIRWEVSPASVHHFGIPLIGHQPGSPA